MRFLVIKPTNLLIGTLNLLHEGQRCKFLLGVPTRPQRRIQDHVMGVASGFLRNAGCVGGEAAIRDLLRETDSYSAASTQALPLGLRSGAPASAGSVDLAKAVSRSAFEMVGPLRDPGLLLLHPRGRSRVLPRAYKNLRRTYPDFLAKNVHVGL